MNIEALHTTTPEAERSQPSREEAYGGVAERVEELLGALDETLNNYCEVKVPCGETCPADGECDKLVARAQELRGALSGLVEGHRDKGDYYGERAAALSEAAVGQIEGFLKVRADLLNEAARNPAARDLVAVLDTAAATLLHEGAQGSDNKEDEHTT